MGIPRPFPGSDYFIVRYNTIATTAKPKPPKIKATGNQDEAEPGPGGAGFTAAGEGIAGGLTTGDTGTAGGTLTGGFGGEGRNVDGPSGRCELGTGGGG